MTEHQTTDREPATAALRQAADQVREVAWTLLSSDFDAAQTDFSAAGDHLNELTSALYGMATYLAVALPHYSDTRILYDETGANPKRRLGDALIQLHQARAAYMDAAKALTAYQAAINSVRVAADVNSPPFSQAVWGTGGA